MAIDHVIVSNFEPKGAGLAFVIITFLACLNYLRIAPAKLHRAVFGFAFFNCGWLLRALSPPIFPASALRVRMRFVRRGLYIIGLAQISADALQLFAG